MKQGSNQRVKDLERSILLNEKEIKILNAEWAYLNNPERKKLLSIIS